jgi:hypothetical protein
MRIKLYKIKEVTYDAKSSSFIFDLLVPLKGSKKPKVTIVYESEIKANILLYQFNQLKLAKLPEDFLVTDLMKEKVTRDDHGNDT